MRYMVTVVWMLGTVLVANAQRVGFEAFDALAEQAGSKTEVDLPRDMLGFAVPFLGDENLEGAARELIERLEGVYVRVLEDVSYSVDQLRAVQLQLQSDNWNRLVNIDEGPDGDQVGVWLYREAEAITGMFVLVAEPDEIVAVNIIGQLDPMDLAILGARFGLPVPDVAP